MRVRIAKWGNSLALRIPKPFAEEAGVTPGSDVQLTVRDGKLVAAPVASRRFTLKDLLGDVRPDNVPQEASFGRRVGREVW